MKSIAWFILRVLVYVLEFVLGVFFIPIALMEMLLIVLYELEFSLSEGERSDPSDERGGGDGGDH